MRESVRQPMPTLPAEATEAFAAAAQLLRTALAAMPTTIEGPYRDRMRQTVRYVRLRIDELEHLADAKGAAE